MTNSSLQAALQRAKERLKLAQANKRKVFNDNDNPNSLHRQWAMDELMKAQRDVSWAEHNIEKEERLQDALKR